MRPRLQPCATWTYDDVNQLTAEHRTGDITINDQFRYDAAGNRTLWVITSARRTYTYDAANQLVRRDLPASIVTYTYDAAGNQEVQIEADARTTLVWDDENRMTLHQKAGVGRLQNWYNGDGQRMERWIGLTSTRYVWDGQNVLVETDGAGNTQAVFTYDPREYGDLISQRREE